MHPSRDERLADLYANQRVGVLFDGQSLYYGARDHYDELSLKEESRARVQNKLPSVDYLLLLEDLLKERTLTKAVAYTVSLEGSPEPDSFLGTLHTFRIAVRHRVMPPGVKPSIWTTAYICEAMKWAASGKFDTIILVTGAGIYTDLVRFLHDYPITVEIAGFGPAVARSLREQADVYHEVTEEHFEAKEGA